MEWSDVKKGSHEFSHDSNATNFDADLGHGSFGQKGCNKSLYCCTSTTGMVPTNVNTLAQRAFPSTSTNMTTASPSIAHIFRGNFVFCTRNPFFTPTEQEVVEEDSPHVQWLGPGLKLLLDHVMTVDTDGRIVQISMATDFDGASPKNWKDLPVTTLPPHSFLVPGLIDTHIHAPQFAYTGTATDRPLMGPDGWLETYTFPAEARLADDAQACRAVYKGVVDTTLVRVRSTEYACVCVCVCTVCRQD